MKRLVFAKLDSEDCPSREGRDPISFTKKSLDSGFRRDDRLDNDAPESLIIRLVFAVLMAACGITSSATPAVADPDLAAEAVLLYRLTPHKKTTTDSRKWCLRIRGDDAQVSRMVLRLAADFPKLMHHAECTLRRLPISTKEYDDLNTGEKLAIVRITDLIVHNDGTANASISIRLGGLNGVGRDFVLKREGEKFVVVSAKVTWVS